MAESTDFTSIEWTYEGESVPGLLKSAGEGAAGVVVVQEWWGITEDIKAQADIVHDMGYTVLIPDLYRGKSTLEAAEAHHLMDGLDWPRAVGEIGAAAAYLRSRGCAKVAVMGFCMGGALTLAAVTNCPEFDCALPFYGIPPDQLADVTTLSKPIQAHFGKLDSHTGFADVTAVEQLQAKLDKAPADATIYSYDTVGHAFMNNTPTGVEVKKANGHPHDPAAIEQAWARVKQFLAEHLK